MRISAALIVRDEEAHLERCLRSIKDAVDEIVVVDTGSIDRSLDIARAHHAIVHELCWSDDFSLARNFGLDRCSGDWILYIDADEELQTTGALHDPLLDRRAVAARVRFRAAQNLTPYLEYRLFRNRPDLRFRGAIHETVMPDLNAILAKEDTVVIDTPFLIEHYGYEGDLTHKHKRNREILYRAAEEDPKRVYLWLALGECEIGSNNIEAAVRALREGLRYLRLGESHAIDALVYANLLKLHVKGLTVLPDFEELHLESRRMHGEDPLVLWWSARAQILAGDAENARLDIQKILAHGPEGPEIAPLGYERRIFGESGWGLMGVCYFSEGNYPKAVEWLERAHAANPDNTEVSAKLTLARVRLNAG